MSKPLLVLLLFAVALSAWADHVAHGSLTVQSVHEGSSAATAGFQPGDRLILLDGKRIGTPADLSAVINGHVPGDTVPAVVDRTGEERTLQLTFGKKQDGSASMGLTLAYGTYDPAAGETAGAARDICLSWIDETYRIEPLMRELKLDAAADWSEVRACTERGMTPVSKDNALPYCDNIFKVHCSAVELLGEIAGAIVQRCEQQLDATLSEDAAARKQWQTCAKHRVFDRYAMTGEVSDAAACRRELSSCLAGG